MEYITYILQEYGLIGAITLTVGYIIFICQDFINKWLIHQFIEDDETDTPT